MTAVCVADDAGRRLWRGQCPSIPERINTLVRRHAGDDARIGIETGAMTPWLVPELRNLGPEVVCLDARHACAALNRGIGQHQRVEFAKPVSDGAAVKAGGEVLAGPLASSVVSKVIDQSRSPRLRRCSLAYSSSSDTPNIKSRKPQMTSRETKTLATLLCGTISP
jgi:hypothetical protein